ncbi:GAF and ANTAR domain-containing protein [Amycolatopsis minnesotensis]|uniref:GAF and ANTAR domain-containing protein n=1 Tax=Amycolatopsis minnesotensis TaxID=337894 RepID=UPI0031D45717
MPEEQRWSRDRDRFLADTRRAAARDEQPRRDHGARLGPLAREFAMLTYALLDADTVGEVLQQIVRAALNVVPGADVVSVTLRDRDGTLYTPVETDLLATDLDKIQYDLGEGPCFDAAAPNGPAMAFSSDLAAESRWPRFGPASARRGVSAVVSTALLPTARSPERTGALNIYSRSPDGLPGDDQDLALLLATHASLALAHSQALRFADLQAAQLRKAIDSRDVIGQAKGILMGRRGITADQAFDILRRTSQDLNVKLVDLAETLADRHDDLDTPDT